MGGERNIRQGINRPSETGFLMFSMQKCVPSLQEAKLEDKKGSLRKEISLVRTNTSVDVPNRRRHDAKNSYLTWLYLLTLRLCEFSPLETVAKGGEKVNTRNVCGKNVSSCNSLGCALFQCRQGPNDAFKGKKCTGWTIRAATILCRLWFGSSTLLPTCNVNSARFAAAQSE